MGICASCLGLNRHPSQEEGETDPLLDEPTTGYGATSGDGQVDEEELQREREELDKITHAATENMIDVHQADAAEVGAATGSQRFSRSEVDHQQTEDANDEDEEEDEEEAAWLQSVQSDNMADVQGMQAGGLVLDVGELRGGDSAARKSLKANTSS